MSTFTSDYEPPYTIKARLNDETMEQIRAIVREELDRVMVLSRPEQPRLSGMLLVGESIVQFCSTCQKMIKDGRQFMWQSLVDREPMPVILSPDWFCQCKKDTP